MYARDTARIATPIGPVTVEAEGDVLTAIRIGGAGEPVVGANAITREAAGQLAAYFAGALRQFDLPLATAATPRGGALRSAIAAIGYGEAASYGEVAAACASSSRAVGQACARNPFPIVIPCHRVLAADGRLGFYSAGDGPATKTWLLDHERAHGEGRLL